MLGHGRGGLWLLGSGRLIEYGFYGLFRATPTTGIVLPGGKLSYLNQCQFNQ